MMRIETRNYIYTTRTCVNIQIMNIYYVCHKYKSKFVITSYICASLL